MYGYIYKTTNLNNGKIYIGQKKSDKFLENKYLGSGKRLREAVNKYGESNFEVELLEEIIDENLMDEREIYWINYYNSTDLNVGYNLSEGGNVNRTLRGINNGFYGKHHSEETKLHLKEMWALNKENRIGINHPNYGNHMKDESKEHISKANKGRIKTEEEKQKRLLTLEANGSKKFYSDPEYRKKLSESKKCKPSRAKGTIHITNDIEDKMIHLDNLEYYLNLGWRRGRKKWK